MASLQPIKPFGTPVVDRLGPISYTERNPILDAGFPKLALNYWKSSFVREVTDDVIAILVRQFARCPSPMSKLILEHFPGAALRPKASDTALPHRDAGYSVLIIAQWRDPEENERSSARAKETFTLLKPFTRWCLQQLHGSG